MQFSEQWLRSYADPPYSSDELAERLTMAGLEVESNEPVAPPFSGVVVGEVTRVTQHPRERGGVQPAGEIERVLLQPRGMRV